MLVSISVVLPLLPILLGSSLLSAILESSPRDLVTIVFSLLVAVAVILRYVRDHRPSYRRLLDVLEARRRLAESRETERLHMARELHDGPMQALYNLGHLLEQCDLRREHGETPGLDAPREAVERLSSELRALCNALRPPVLTHFGLPAALEHLAVQLRREHVPLLVETDVDDDASALPEAHQHALFRIAQEALHNAARHARARRLSLMLRCTQEVVILDVTDDGRGFQLPRRWVELARDEHFGLLGMMERAASAGGTCTVNTRPGHGTRIRVSITRPATAESPESRHLTVRPLFRAAFHTPGSTPVPWAVSASHK